ncbi:GNAT family N-acetyltransferase [Streptomyces sp. NBC_00083]|uniref:GNAT family N-acetyltransferase n=1 Tax=Streptomyces sp. NBC_00083 TaxID=2975647 RepID=UPI00224C9EE8|nr:GNAT family N-acetyltransferase [Streptomyces sp. NBC_00083]MCX5387810.1 GNAT family N-acetyltransferase [Streptomyces sp. NBC_00083]
MSTPAAPDVDVRAVTEAEFADWIKAVQLGFLRPPVVSEQYTRDLRANSDLGRVLAGFDDGRCVATYRSFAQELTVPGGAALPVSAVSAVTVAPTHRRRGLLTRMMAADLAAARERGEVASTLIAAEYPIYGRYGFGPATWLTEWEIDVARAGLDPKWSRPADGGRIDLVSPADAAKIGTEVFEQFRPTRAGAISRDRRWWDLATGASRRDGPWTEPFFAVYRTTDGDPAGLVAYTADDRWSDAKLSENTATVQGLIGLTPEADRALWHYLCSIDWIRRVRTGYRAPDDLLPHYLPNPRAAGIVTHADFLWLRLLDVVRALEARTYAAEGALVLEIEDESGPAGGRYLLEANPAGASCTPTTRTAELTLHIRELSSLYLGDQSATRLLALDRLTEERPGAAAHLDTLFRTNARPWCPDMF